MFAMIRGYLGSAEPVGYVALFFGIMLENAGVPLPGETALLAAGYLSSPEGGGKLQLGIIIPVAFLGAVLGDNLGYLLGRRLARPRLAAGKRFLFLTPERFQKTEAYFAKYGAATVFFGRWIALLRIAAGPAAGAAGMRWRTFLIANAAGAAVWASVVAVLGYAAGPAWEALQRWLGRGAWIAIGLVVLAVIGWKVSHWLRRKQPVEPLVTPPTQTP